MNRPDSIVMTIHPSNYQIKEDKEVPKKITPAEQKKRVAELKRGVTAAKKEVTRMMKVCTDGAAIGTLTKADTVEYRQATSAFIKVLQAYNKAVA